MPTDSGCPTEFQIGPDESNLEDVKIEPRGDFVDETELGISGDAKVLSGGFPKAVWNYPQWALSGLQWRQLKDRCSGDSATVCVRTKTNEVDSLGRPVFRTYTAEMKRPQGVPVTKIGQEQFFEEVSVEFIYLQEVTTTSTSTSSTTSTSTSSSTSSTSTSSTISTSTSTSSTSTSTTL